MASVKTQLKSFKTGAGMGFPVIMNNGINWHFAMDTVEIKDDDEIAIGDIILIDTNKLADQTGDESVLVSAIVLDHTDNKAILEGHGLTVNKTSQFKDGDTPVIAYLVPGMILSMKFTASTSAVVYGSKVCSSGTPGQIKLLDVSANDEPAAKLGYSLAKNTNGTGLQYLPIMITM